MAIYPVAGMRIYIGGIKADQSTDFVAADFAGESWVEIDGWQNAGPVGDGVNLITTQIINRNRDTKQKGTAAAPSMDNQFVVIAADPGQVALIAAGQPSNKNSYAFRIDGNESGVSTVSKRYFIGLVMGTPEQGGGANTARLLSATVEINSNIVSVAAVP